MTEMLANAETTPSELGALLAQWEESPPPSLSGALSERGLDVEALENHARSDIPTEELERLRRVLVNGATSGNSEDAELLRRLLPVLDPRERAWDRVMKAKATGEVLTATVTEAVKGGVVVDLGVRGFVPSSQIGLSVPRNLNQYVGRPLKLRVMEVDRRRQTVILTNRQVMEEERAGKRKAAIGRLEEGQVRPGIIRRLTEIGAFVDVGGVDGLLHVSEISWKRVERPSDELKVGQKVQVKVLKVDAEAGRVSLSMRRLSIDPWEEARRKYAIGSTVKVTISRTVAQGAVVDLDEGLEGFIPISELASRRVATVEEVVQPGQEVDALVIDLRPRERRVVFSLRKLEQKRDRQVVETYQRKARSTSERTTLGDLFGHLFEEYQGNQEEETPAATAESAAPQDVEAEAPVAAAAEGVGTEEADTDTSTLSEDPAAEAALAVEEAQEGEDTVSTADPDTDEETPSGAER